MVKRLTNPNGDGFIACNGCTKPHCNECEAFKEQAEKLASYEDTGLTIGDIQAYASAEQEKRIVIFESQETIGHIADLMHGQWNGWATSAYIGIDKDGEPKFAPKRFYRCDKCNYGTVVKTKHCPNCGAKMDGNCRGSEDGNV